MFCVILDDNNVGYVVIAGKVFIYNATQEVETVDLLNVGAPKGNLQRWNSTMGGMHKHTLGLGSVDSEFKDCVCAYA